MDWTRRSAFGALGAAAFAADALAQKKPKAPPAPVPFALRSRDRVFVEATINGLPVVVMIDNGLFGVLLSRSFAHAHNLESDRNRMASGLAVPSKDNQKLVIGPMTVDFGAGLIDLSMASRSGDGAFTAVIGQPVLRIAPMLFDFDERLLHIPETRNDPLPLPDGMTLIPMRQAKDQPLPQIDVVLDGVAMKADVRFGANAAISVSDGAMRDKWLPPGRAWSTSGSYTQGVVGSSESKNLLTTLPSLQIGPFRFADAPLEIVAEDGNQAPPADGQPRVTIGMPVLSRFSMFYDARNLDMRLKPNGRHDDKWDRNVLGLGVQQDGEKLVVMHIGENSPAQAAGFRVGEVVTAVNGGPATLATLNKVKAGETIELRMEDGSLRTIDAREHY